MTLVKRTERRSAKRVYELAQKLMNDHMRDAEWRELQALLKHDDEACRAYIEAMLLHAGLDCLGKERAIGKEQ